jgi:hypothetical protein
VDDEAEAFMHVRRVMAVCFVAAVVSAAWPVLAQRNNDNKGRQQSTRSPQEQQDVQALVQAVDAALMTDTGIPVPSATAPATPPAAPTPQPLALGAPDKCQCDIPIKWEINHFVKGQTDTYMPFTINVDRSALAGGAAVYVRIVNADQANAFAGMMAKMATAAQSNNKNQPAVARPTFSWDSINFVDVPEDGRLSRAVQLKPGQYAMFVAVKEKTPASAASGGKNDRKGNDKNQPVAAAPGKVGVLRHDLMVPDFTSNDLATSSVIIAKQVEQVNAPPSDQESNPYVFGPMKITPSVDGKFTKKDELSVIFWIYGAQAAATGKPDVTIDFNFHQKLAEGEKYFNKTAPQQLNAQTLPPEFSVAAGHQLPGSLVVPLSSFPAGDYRLEIKVTDKPSGKTVTQNVNFSVSG